MFAANVAWAQGPVQSPGASCRCPYALWKAIAMNSQLYVGNLSTQTTEDDLRGLFSEIGSVLSVKVAIDHNTGTPKGYGFVSMETSALAQEAVASLNNRRLHDHDIQVTVILPPEERDQRHSVDGGFRPRKRGGPKRD